jgi:hypothetical protein
MTLDHSVLRTAEYILENIGSTETRLFWKQCKKNTEVQDRSDTLGWHVAHLRIDTSHSANRVLGLGFS